ncbi:MAG: single-stranded DNA-binding protein [Phycisphaerae bacterium]|jgi:single-strand DNA-binding protein|nr:single-stranded DNA-binding protein [Phycisphaerae bacterium]
MVNKVQLIGRLGRDPEVRATQENVAFARFSLATDSHWTDRNGDRQSRAEWHNVLAWGRLAEICGEYLRKGRLVFVEGRLQTRSWEDEAGQRHSRTEVVIHDLKILEPKQPVEAPQPPADTAAEIPF